MLLFRTRTVDAILVFPLHILHSWNMGQARTLGMTLGRAAGSPFPISAVSRGKAESAPEILPDLIQ